MVLVTRLVSNQALIVPASQGLTVLMDCKENYIRFEYACLPAKFDVGDLKCTMKSVRKRKPYRRYTLGIAGFFHLSIVKLKAVKLWNCFCVPRRVRRLIEAPVNDYSRTYNLLIDMIPR